MRQYVIDQAQQGGHPWRDGRGGNLVVASPPVRAWRSGPVVIIQNHLDMVTVKTGDKDHDFASQPLNLQVADGWLQADRTTLGADNGVGCAAALALMTDPAVRHPPLELLFTVDEETGLGGALNLDPALLSGSLMLNLDTEDWQELYRRLYRRRRLGVAPHLRHRAGARGCGAVAADAQGPGGRPFGYPDSPAVGQCHQAAGAVPGRVAGVQLAGIDAGVAHNVIPREGSLAFCLPRRWRRAAARAAATAAGTSGWRICRRRMAAWHGPAADHLRPGAGGRGYPDHARSGRPVSPRRPGLQPGPAGGTGGSQHQPGAAVGWRRASCSWSASFRFFNEAQSLPLQQSGAGTGPGVRPGA